MISVPVKRHILFAVYTMMTGDAGLGSGVAHTVTTPGDSSCFYIKHALLGANELATLTTLAFLLTCSQQLHNLGNNNNNKNPAMPTDIFPDSLLKKSTTSVLNSGQLAT